MMRAVLQAWREAIAAELATAKAELAAAVKAVAEAEVEAASARRARRDLSDAISKLGANRTIAGSLHWRIREHGLTLAQPDGNVVRAKNEVKTCRALITDLEEALEQLKQMEPVQVEAAA